MRASLPWSRPALRAGALLGLALTLVGCSGQPPLDPYAVSPLDYPVETAGPLGVGYRVLETTYDPGGLGSSRTLPIHVWYPTQATDGSHPTYAGFFLDPASIEDAPLAPSPYADGRYPVHVFSHGHLGFGQNAYPLMVAFASHGWVAVAPDHVGNTLSNDIQPETLAKWYTRPLDLSATLDHLDALPASDPLSGALTIEAVLMSGHSRGVFTTWAVSGATFDVPALEARCAGGDYDGGCTPDEIALFDDGFRDVRVVASVAMAGSISNTWFGASGHAGVTIPMLAMSGGDDPVGADAQFAQVDGLDFTWVDIADGCHQLFGFGGCPLLPNEVGLPIVATYARAFGRRHVLSDDGADVLGILDGSVEVSPLVTFMKK